MSDTAPHYIILTFGSTGDVHPLLRLAKALRAMGRKVAFITDSYHANLVQSAGIPFVGLGDDESYLQVVANPNLWDPRKGFATLMATYGDQLQLIDGAIRSVAPSGPLVVIAHPLLVPGAAIARECGVVSAVVSVCLAPSNMRSCHDPLTIGPSSIPRWVPMSWRRALWRFVEKYWIDPVVIAQLNAVREPLGLPSIDTFLTHITDAPDLTITLFPSWFAPATPDWPRPLIEGDFQVFEASRLEGNAEALSAFLAAGDKPLVFTPGTGNVHAAAFFDCALAAVNRLGRRAIFLTRERGQIAAQLPASVLWQPYVPLAALLPHSAAIIHHGGIGTTAEALRAGTPQLVVPFAWDQFDNGARVAALGVGLVIPAKRLRPRALTRSLRVLGTSISIRAHCAEVASRFSPIYDSGDLCQRIDSVLQAQLERVQSSISA